MFGRQLDDQTAMNHRPRCWQHNQAAIRLARECGDAALNIFRAFNADRTYLDPERWPRAVDGAELTHPGGIGRISKHCRPRDLGRDLLEKLQPFDAHSKFGRSKAGSVAARTRQASNNSCAHCIGD